MPSITPPTLTAALLGQPTPDVVELTCVAVTEAATKTIQALSVIQDLLNRDTPYLVRDIFSKEQSAEVARKFANFLIGDEDGPSLPARIAALMAAIDTIDDGKVTTYFREHQWEGPLYGTGISMAIDCIVDAAQRRLDFTSTAVREALAQSVRAAAVNGVAVAGAQIPVRTRSADNEPTRAAGQPGLSGVRKPA